MAIRNVAHQTLELVEQWSPEEDYGREHDFQKDLCEYLDKELNRRSYSGLNQNHEHVVSREHGEAKGDVVVDDRIGIELKRDFTNSQRRKLEGQIKAYREEYDFVIVCACGVMDMDGWRRLKNEYQHGGTGIGDLHKAPVEFVHKRKSEYGTDKQRGDGTQNRSKDRSDPAPVSDGISSGDGLDAEKILEDGIAGIQELTSDEDTGMKTSQAIVAVAQLALLVGVFLIVGLMILQVIVF